MNCYPALSRIRITPQAPITSATDKTAALFPYLGCTSAVHGPEQAKQACHGNDRQFVKHRFLPMRARWLFNVRKRAMVFHALPVNIG